MILMISMQIVNSYPKTAYYHEFMRIMEHGHTISKKNSQKTTP